MSESADMKKLQAPFLIFSGYNDRGVIAFCRYAANKRIPFYIVACKDSDPIFATAYARNVVAVRAPNALNRAGITDLMCRVRETANGHHFLCLPSSEFLNRFLIDERAYLESLGLHVTLCRKEVYEQISDKWKFARLCQVAGLQVPRESSCADELGYPFVAKPRSYFGSQGQVQPKPVLIHCAMEFEVFSKQFNCEEFFFQEFVGGESCYLLLHVSKEEGHVMFSQRNLIQQGRGRSIIAALPDRIHEHPIAARYLSLLRSVDFHGLIMIELRKLGEDFVMIEANPRVWGPMQLIVDCRTGILDQFVRDHGHGEAASEWADVDCSGRYFWSGGLVSPEGASSQTTYHGYTAEELNREFGIWIRHDVWLRPDSKDYYYRELSQNEG